MSLRPPPQRPGKPGFFYCTHNRENDEQEKPDDPALMVVRYTHRQKRAVENVRFVLEQALKGSDVPAADADAEYAGAVAGPIHEAQALVAGNQAAVLWRLLGYLGRYRRQVALGFTAATLITAVSLVPPYLAGFLIDKVVQPVQDGVLSVQEGASIAWIAVGAMVLVYLVRQSSALVRLRYMSVLGEWVARDLRTELYEHLQRLSLSFYSRKKTGALITRVSSDTDRLWDFLAFGIIDVSLSVVMLIGLSTVLLSLDWKLGLVVVVPVPLFCLAIYKHSERMNRFFIRAWRKWSRVTDVLSDTIPGIRVVKAFNQEEREIGRFKEGIMIWLKKEPGGSERLKLERRADGQLWADLDGEERAVRVHRCFPWSEPGRFLSLRDTDNEEFALVESVDELCAGSRRVLEEALVEAGFVLEVTGVIDVIEEVEIRIWKVETRQGVRTFQTPLDDWPSQIPGGAIVIKDVAGDLYHIADPEAMDDRSRKWLWAFVD